VRISRIAARFKLIAGGLSAERWQAQQPMPNGFGDLARGILLDEVDAPDDSVWLGIPTLLIWGDHDRIIPVAHAHAAHDALPGSRLVVLPGVGHYPHLEAGEAIINTLNDFCATTTPWQRSRRAKMPVAADPLR
jgi:pimeloyl-ACP methyl ester carboxylesterase